MADLQHRVAVGARNALLTLPKCGPFLSGSSVRFLALQWNALATEADASHCSRGLVGCNNGPQGMPQVWPATEIWPRTGDDLWTTLTRISSNLLARSQRDRRLLLLRRPLVAPKVGTTACTASDSPPRRGVLPQLVTARETGLGAQRRVSQSGLESDASTRGRAETRVTLSSPDGEQRRLPAARRSRLVHARRCARGAEGLASCAGREQPRSLATNGWPRP
eukprot:scaffold635_cov535-Prasinococcus_capsulatus_cf.AAC.2